MGDFDYDLFVIGGGSGGVRAARMAAARGAAVGLAESSRLGGTCVIRGCVPKKLMVFASSHRHLAEEASAYGWSRGTADFDWTEFRGNLARELSRLEGVYRSLLENSGVEIHGCRAGLKDAHTVLLADGSEKTAKHILLAQGGRPARPDIPNADLGIVSDDIFDLPELPKSVLIVGGGYIACEFACILNGLGVEVVQYYRGARILRGFDDEARGLIAEAMRAQGVDLRLDTNIAEMAPAPDGRPSAGTGPKGPVRVASTDGGERVFDRVLFATGRAPNVEGMGLEDVGVKIGRRGGIEVNDYSQTAVPSIYAIGDVTRRIELTPVAIREGMAFVETVFGGNPTKVDHELVPSAVFTRPEYGFVGLSEEEGRRAGPVEIYATTFRPMRTAFAGRPDQVMMKLVVCARTRRVMGCHIIAPEAGEMIQLAGVAVKMGATKEDFDRVCAVHPTMSEELVTMREPVRGS